MKIKPMHPGLYLNEILRELRFSQSRLSRDINVKAMLISRLVNGARPKTAELALRLGRYFSQDPRYWLKLQNRYDIDVAEDKLGKRVIRKIRPLKKVA
ncbi:MAG: HigA family addiction module antidote protein [Deltaproteobacteria bacterium]|nr:HigA family addiction module antidote protein [Deltaproteobacteria bacterium]